ncbi:MAG: formylglycine-generating enzyme family protein, partial [Sediminibacterium sp.]|nr:formylglycine-generating enzyme family protein [Sediminibacterium sp.]
MPKKGLLRFIILPIVLALSVSIQAQNNKRAFEPYAQSITGSQLSIKLVTIPAGSFTMGSPGNEPDRQEDEGPQRKVSIAAFWMSSTEITWDVYDIFLKDETTSINTEADA